MMKIRGIFKTFQISTVGVLFMAALFGVSLSACNKLSIRGVTQALTGSATVVTISVAGSPFIYQNGIAVTTITPTLSSNVVSVSISPNLTTNTGLTFNTTTGEISGTPTINSTATTYTLTAAAADGTTATTTIVITVYSRVIGGAITSGLWHSCAVVNNGGVQCWGFNGNGRLGDGTTNDSTIPVNVSGLTSGVTAVSAGAYHTCAVKNGGVWCWGWNRAGQLGDNTLTDSSVPVQVKGLGGVGVLSGVTAIASANDHTCAISSGSVYCWGFNGPNGCLGNNSTVTSKVPVQVKDFTGAGTLSGVQAIAADGYNTCAMVDGFVGCWGANNFGQLGDNTTTGRLYPVKVVDIGGVGTFPHAQQISAGYAHFCALANGRVYCWGSNMNGQLGDNTTTDSSIPVQVKGLGGVGTLANAQSIELGENHSCAIVDGKAQCWGYNSMGGSLGNNSTVDSWVPVNVLDTAASGPLRGVQALAGGHGHTCAVVNGAVHCWGYNGMGQLGNGDATFTDVPYPTATQSIIHGLLAVSAGETHNCAIVDGGVQCWGDNTFGQLGNNSTTQSNTPVRVKGVGGVGYLDNVQFIASADAHTCAVANGAALCWGRNSNGQLGNSTTTDSLVPVNVTGLSTGVRSIVGGWMNSCAIVNGEAKCWGFNMYGSLGDGTNTDRSSPVTVSGLTADILALSEGPTGFHQCAVKAGSVVCWGYNNSGQLGNASTINSNAPVPVSGMTNGSSLRIVKGYGHTCSMNYGSILCWGGNGNGQLGDGSTTQSSIPVYASLTEPLDVTAGGYFSGAVYAGGAYMWGNAYYAYGPSPVPVAGFTSGTLSLSAGGGHTCGIVNGRAQCIQDNTFGQLGVPILTASATPVFVSDWQ